MLVMQLVGNRAGEIIDMPFVVARGCIAAGTAIRPDAELPRKTVIVEIPPDWMSAHHFQKMKWARDISGGDVNSKVAAEAIIARHLENRHG